MGRKKTAKNCEIPFYLSSRMDCKDGRFIQVGNSLFFSKQFNALTAGAQILFLKMAMEAGGKTEYTFPRASFKKYGLSESSARRHIKELIEHKFISCESGWTIREKNIYRFSFSWKKEQTQ